VVTARRALMTATVAGGSVALLRAVAGVWITSAVIAGVAVVALVAGWAAIERRAFPCRPPAPAPVMVGPRRHQGERRLAFARALAVVAAAYLAESERDERRETW
jgi:hypothetical protein